MHSRLKRMLLVGHGVLLLAALSSYALLGWHVRMLADDYCTAASALNRTVLESIIYDYYNWNWTYVDSFLKAVLARFQPAYHQVQTLLLLTALFAALWWLVREVAAVLDLPAMRKHSLLVAVLFLLLIVYTAPNPSMLYWHAVIVPYSLPIALIVGCVSALIRYVRLGFQHTWRYAVLFAAAVAWLIGSANTFFLPLIGTLALSALYTLWRVPSDKKRHALTIVGVSAVTALLTFALVFSAPGNAVRQTAILYTSGFSTPSIDRLILLTFTNTWSYLAFPYFYTVVYSFFGLGIGVVLTVVFYSENPEHLKCVPFSERWLALDGLAVIVLTIGIALSTIATTVYGVGTLVWHTMFFPRAAQMLCMLLLGCMLIVWLSRRNFLLEEIKQRPVYKILRLMLVSLLIVPPLSALGNNLARLPQFQQYAEDWDRTHAYILSQVATGNRGIIEVPRYRFSLADSFFVEDIDKPDGFVRSCAASYYGVQDLVMPPRPVDSVGISREDQP